MSNRVIRVGFMGIMLMIFSCGKDKVSKPVTNPPAVQSLYSDSVFYIQGGVSNYVVTPVETKTGTYTCVPEGLELDASTGAINVNKSETGLKYKVSFTPAGSGETQIANIIISGINYEDKIYNLSAGDSIAMPIYNANNKISIPGMNGGSIFDQNGGCKDAGIEVDKNTGVINLAKSVRDQGIDTGATQEVKLVYKINDDSHQASNGLDVKVYFYRTVSEIPQYLLDLLAERKRTIQGTNSVSPAIIQSSRLVLNRLTTVASRTTRPRPPCVIVVSR